MGGKRSGFWERNDGHAEVWLLGAKRRPRAKKLVEMSASRFAGPALSTTGRVMPQAAPPASMELIFLMAQDGDPTPINYDRSPSD